MLNLPSLGFIEPWLVIAMYAIFGLPLTLQDLHESSVSAPFLFVAYGAWAIVALLGANWSLQFELAAAVLAVGMVFLFFFRGKLGEADIIFMSGTAFMLPFWPLMVAFALACIAALTSFLLQSFRDGHSNSYGEPIPFLPALFWGGLTILLGKL